MITVTPVVSGIVHKPVNLLALPRISESFQMDEHNIYRVVDVRHRGFRGETVMFPDIHLELIK